jgi:peptidyl-prolyl cis-trans isomerase SurA
MKAKFFSTALFAILTVAASAQVASHAPTVAMSHSSGSSAAAPPITEVTGKIVARVNGAELTDRDLVREMFALFPYAAQHNGFPKDLEPEIRRGAMQMIIFEELLYQDAKRKGVTIPPARLSEAEATFRKNFPSQVEYDTYLRVEGIKSKQQLREKIRRSLLIDQMLKTQIASKARLTPAQVKEYYDKNPKQFYREETFHIQSISILPPNAAPDTLKEAKRRADDAYNQARTAKSYKEFGLLAEKLSDDDFHVNYGDHKPQPRKDLPPEVVKVALTMKPGQVSSLIQLGNAYTIFRLVAHTPAGRTPFAEVKEKLQADLQNQRTEQIRAALGSSLRKDAKIEIM